MSATETRASLRPISMQEAVGYERLETIEEAALQDRIVLKHDRLFLLLDGHGNIEQRGRSALGLFFDDTRILSCYELLHGAGAPVLLSAQVPRQFLAQVDLAIDDRLLGGHPWDPKNCIHVRREFLLDQRMVERVTLTNYLTRAIDYTLELRIASDFADIFEVRGWKREQRGQFYSPAVRDDAITFLYRDLSGRMLASAIVFAQPPDRVDAKGAYWRFRLGPDEVRILEWEIASCDGQIIRSGPTLGERTEPLLRAYEAWRSECSRWASNVEEFNLALRHATDDLRALYIEADGESVISAGIPWYSTVFGRDSIITSLQTLPLNPRIAIDTLRYLARHQGTTENPVTEEQPGRILHELRRGEMARSGEIPHTPYYGTIDATPLWLVLLHETWRWTGSMELVTELLPNALRALQWIDRFGDLDGDGLVEYATTSDRGLVNQGWKDSGDGVPFPDGTLPEPPIALIEVQGYVCDAKARTAQLLDALGRTDDAQRLRQEADLLRRRIEDRFWLDDPGTFALALDGHKRPLPTITTNAGHVLWSRVASQERAERVANLLLGPEMFSGWGIRTLSERHAVYNPMSYHDGSVWPHDNAIVVMGLAQYGMALRALPVVSALHNAAVNMRFHRLPELFCGMRRAHGQRPVLYPVSCSPQAWASGAFFMMLQAVLGIRPDAPNRTLHIREPQLPPFLDRLTISGLRIGASSVGLEFRRHRDRTLANLLGVEGERLRVGIELA